MTELALFELMSEADCELLARSDVRVNVHRKIGLRVLAVAAAVSVLLIVSLFVGAFAVVHNYKEQHPEIQGGIVEVLGGVLADEDSFLSEMLPENVKLELGDLIVKLGGENPFVPLGPGEEQSTGATETEKETNSNNGVPWHEECDYCGKLDGENRWFIAKVIDSKTVMPIGENCCEAVSAGDAGFRVIFLGDNLIEKQGFAPGDIVRITYNGYLVKVETYPWQIYPDSIEPVEGYETESETEPNDNGLWHNACEYCGNLDGENRWFIAEIIDSKTVKPFGEKCFEAVSAGEAGFEVNFLGENMIEQQGFAPGDIVRITYNGYVVETYPGQIYPDSIEPIEPPEFYSNLEFWIAENVDNVDFSAYQEKYGMFGGRQYYGKGYVPTVDQDGQVDPEHCVIYTVTSYPDYADKSQHITCIEITDPKIMVCGITVNSSFEEFERIVLAYGMELEETNGNYRTARQGKFSISIDGERITLRVEVENKDGIIF